MQDDVEQVARAMAAAAGLDWDGKAKNTEYANHGYWLPVARAAMAATREIDAEALRKGEDWLNYMDGRLDAAIRAIGAP